MHKFVSFNGRISSSDEVRSVGITDSMLYGKGVFTTIAIRDGKTLLWEKHWRRLSSNAKQLRLDTASITDRSLFESLDALITENSVYSGRARVTILDGSSKGLWSVPGAASGSVVLITTADTRPLPDPFRLTVSPFPVNTKSPLVNTKSCNYLENLLAFEEAKERGFHEAVRLNENGHVASATMANIFWKRDGRIYSPDLTTGCLEGTTREYLSEMMKIEFVHEAIESLTSAESIYLTSAGLGIVVVAELDGKSLTVDTLDVPEV